MIFQRVKMNLPETADFFVMFKNQPNAEKRDYACD